MTAFNKHNEHGYPNALYADDGFGNLLKIPMQSFIHAVCAGWWYGG